MHADQIFVVGTSQSVAPVALRERLHLDLHEVYRALGETLVQRGVLAEAVPLSTCGRFELYGVSRNADRARKLLVRMLADRVGVDRTEVRKHLYALRGQTAVRHLLRVASGLDSVVHGEAQILGQVRKASTDSRAIGIKGPVLHRLFDTALATGKRVRSETQIGRGAASLASAAMQMVRRDIGSLEDASALVIGTGDTGALMARLLRKAGVGRLVLANRTVETADAVAAPLGAEVVGLDSIPSEMRRSDLIVGAVTSDRHVLSTSHFEGVERGDRTLRLLDLAHPRNFEPELAALPGVVLFDLDQVFARVEEARASRAAEIPRAEGIVRAQATTFVEWHRSRRSVETLKAMRARVLAVANEEAVRFSQGMGADEQEQMRRLARSLARTLLHEPTVALRSADPESPEGRFLLERLPALFGVEPLER